MEFDLAYAQTRLDLQEEVQAKMKEGWARASDVLPIRPPNVDHDVPNFIYYVQVLVRIDKKKKRA